MRTKITRVACIAAVIAIGCLGAFAPAAHAAGNSGSATGIVFDLGPFPGQAPASCPATVTTDDFALSFVSGNINKSGQTIEGNAYLVDETLSQTLYFGHATLWGNATNFTGTFHGSDPVNGTLDFHVTANKPHGIQVAKMTCS